MAKYLVTGGCGFIGSHLSDLLIQRGHQVKILDDLSTGKISNAPSEAEIIVGTILDKTALRKALEGIDGCFHLAAVVSVEKTIRKWSESHSVNQLGTVTLFETIAEHTLPIPVIYASSSAVYGDCKTLPIAESAPLQPLSPYAVDKMCCEYHAAVAWSLYHIPTVGLRLFNVYGPRQDASSPYSGVISLFVDKICKLRPITIYGDGLQKRDFIHVRDVARFFAAAMENSKDGATIYNVCTGRAISIQELANTIEKISQKKAEKIYAPPRTGEILLSVGDLAHTQKTLNICTEINLEIGIDNLIQETYLKT